MRSIFRIFALVVRYFYLIKTSFPRILELMYWPTFQMILWGLISKHLTNSNDTIIQIGGVLIAGVLLWDILFRSQLGFSISFLEEIWSRNLGQLFVSPLKPLELVLSLMTISFIRTTIAMIPAALLAIPLYSFSLFQMGLRQSIEMALMETIVGGKKSTKKASKSVVVWRRAESRLKQDGWIGSVNDDPLPPGLTGVSAGGNLLVKENGLQFSVSLSEGQKTGFYCDQRDNRLSLRAVAQGKDVLDAYCYTGGFAINAAIGGAARVVAVDSSQPALDTAAENARLNGLVVAGDEEGQESKHAVLELVKGDCVEVMKRLAEKGEKFDVVICDPPKLAPSRRDLAKARPKYLKINSLAMSLVRPGGLLLTCTCSAAMTQAGKDTDNGTKEGGRESGRSGDGGREGWRKSGGNGGGGGGGFLGMLSEAAKLARREVTLLSSSGAAADHPVSLSYQEGAYLTAALLHVH